MEQAMWIGKPWPELNEGLWYTDIVKCPPNASLAAAAPSLLEYYSSRYKESASKQGWLQRIQNGQICVDGNVTTTSDLVLRGGEKLSYHRLPWREPDVPYRLGVLYEDEHLVAVNKPSGLQVLPGGLFQQRTVLAQLQWHTAENAKTWQTSSNLSLEEARLWKPAPIHRLGRGTSGVLLCAKSPTAKSRLAADLAAGTSASISGRSETVQWGANDTRGKDGDLEADRRIQKTYQALASGLIMDDEVFADFAIGKVQYTGVAGGLYMALEKGGKPSRSKITVLWRNIVDKQTLVEVQIFTGRPHQIRIHLAAIGHPLVGDPLYISGGRPRDDLSTAMSENNDQDILEPAEDGYSLSFILNSTASGYQRPTFALPGDCGYFLHAWQLTFIHPITNQKMNIVAPSPPQLCATLEEKSDGVIGLD